MEAGTRKAMDQQKKAAADYVSFWKKAVDDRVRNETNADVEVASRRNRARQLMRQRELEQERRHQRDMAKVSEGYVPETWRTRQSINEKYAGKPYATKGGAAGSQAGMAAAAGAQEILSGGDASIAGKVAASAFFGAGIFDVVKKMTEHLIKHTAKLATQAISRVPAIGALGPLGALFAGFGVGRWIRQTYAPDVQKNQKEFGFGGTIGPMITKALEQGRITFERAKWLRTYGDRNDFIDFAAEQRKQDKARQAQAMRGYELDAQFEQVMTPRRRLGERIRAARRAVEERNFETVSIADIAGRDFSSKIAEVYGEGGARDLASGKGRLRLVAQEYEKARYEQMWQRMQGNKGAAEAAKERMTSMETILSRYGATTEKMDINAMRNGIDEMVKLMNNLNVRIVEVNE